MVLPQNAIHWDALPAAKLHKNVVEAFSQDGLSEVRPLSHVWANKGFTGWGGQGGSG